MEKTIRIEHEAVYPDGDKRTLTTISDIEGNIQQLWFKGKAKDFQKK